MRTTIDAAGRVVIPKALRDRAGLQAGEIDVVLDGAAIRIESVSTDDLVEEGGLLFLPDTDEPVDTDTLREFRLADQR